MATAGTPSDKNAPSHMEAGTTWYYNGADSQGLSYEKTILANGTTEHKHYVNAGGVTFALYVQREGNLNGKPTTSTSYFHHDHLGSIAAVSNATGVVVERMAYDPWGKRRFSNGTNDRLDALYGVSTDRGYTMHEHLDEMGIIHMNGRVYDPLNGRFMSADPFIQAPGNLQSYNRYAYVMNNPMAMTDPSGYWSWRSLVRTLVTIAVAYYTGGLVTGSEWALCTASGATWSGVAAGAAGGFAAGATGAALNGANLNQSLQAGLQGGFTGALFGAASMAGGYGEAGANSYARYAAHAGAGCVSSVASGGNCGQGAASAVFGKFTSNGLGGLKENAPISEVVGKGVATAVAGGVGSVIGGGKFANGAMTAAYGYLFNELSRGFSKEQAGYEVRRSDLSYGEAADHWANGGGMDVRVPLSSLDLSSVRTADFAGVGDQRVFNLSGNVSTRLSDQLVYGNVTLKLVAPGLVEAGLGYDRYNFDMKPLTVSTLSRNVATGIGSIANGVASTIRNTGAGSGTPFFIQLDGRAGVR